MLQVTCLEKVKDKDKIIGYILMDKDGNQKFVHSEQLKSAVKNNQIRITNLKLASDGRLVNKKDKDWHGDYYIKSGFPDISKEVTGAAGDYTHVCQAQRLSNAINSIKSNDEFDAEYPEYTKMINELSKDTFQELIQQSGLSKNQILKMYDTIDGNTQEEKLNNLAKYLVKVANDRVSAEKHRLNSKIDKVENGMKKVIEHARENVDQQAVINVKKSGSMFSMFNAFKR